MKKNDTKRLFLTLALANFFLYFGFNVWRTVFNNFAVEELGVTASQVGVIQAIREIPGLLGFTLGFLALVFSEMRIMGLSVLLLGVGILVTGFAEGLGVLVLGSMLMSIGFHYFYPSNSSVVLMGFDKEQAPKALGYLRSISSLAAVIGTGVVFFFVEGKVFGPIQTPAWGYRTTLIVTGAVVLFGSLFAMRNGRGHGRQQEKRKVILRRAYWLYYALTFMMGSRRHIFTTFAIFMLVQIHGISVSQTALLFFATHVISTIASPTLGWLVAHFGERKVLTVNFLGLIGVFLGYAFVPSVAVLFALFVLDQLFFGFNLALESYFQKIAHSQDEITSNLSTAQTINHISALIVPIVGGILWDQIAPAATFLAGVAIAVISLVLVQFIRTGPTTRPVPVAAAD